MKALTICQPYAELILRGVKPIENRTWATPYRGQLAIHAGRSKDWMGADDDPKDFVFGAIVGVVDLWGCVRLENLPPRARANEHANGPWCWIVVKPRRLKRPIPYRGAQQLWHVPMPIQIEIERELHVA